MIRQRLLQDKVLCIFCDNEVGTRIKPEHILLDALGSGPINLLNWTNGCDSQAYRWKVGL